MPFAWEQGALVPPAGDSPSWKGWLPAHTNPLCAAGGGWQLLQPSDLGEGFQTLVTFPLVQRDALQGIQVAEGIVPGQTLMCCRQGLQSISITAGQRGITFPLPYFIFSSF